MNNWRTILAWQVEQVPEQAEVWYLWDVASLMANVFEVIAKLRRNLRQWGEVKLIGNPDTIEIPETMREDYRGSLLTYIGFSVEVREDQEDSFDELIYGLHDSYGHELSDEIGIDHGRSWISCGVASFGSKDEMIRAIRSQLRIPIDE